MASRIKGITVEIGGDTTGLDKALKNVNATIRTTQSSLKDVNKLLKLDPANTELLAQKQKLLKDAIGSTKEKLDALKTAQEQSKQQMENGDLGQDKGWCLIWNIPESIWHGVIRKQAELHPIPRCCVFHRETVSTRNRGCIWAVIFMGSGIRSTTLNFRVFLLADTVHLLERSQSS